MYFKRPEEYIFMEKQGWLETQDIVYANDVENKYLWLNDMEWFSLDRIKKYINLAGDEEKFIPFAHTVSYDKWAWYIENNKNISVVLLYNDEDAIQYYAPNFAAGLFRQILNFCSSTEFYDENTLKEINNDDTFCSFDLAKKHLRKWKNSFKELFPEEYIKVIDNIIQHSKLKLIQLDNIKYYAIISPEEEELLVKKYMYSPLINKDIYIQYNRDLIDEIF